jgi:hypothetical protein
VFSPADTTIISKKTKKEKEIAQGGAGKGRKKQRNKWAVAR